MGGHKPAMALALIKVIDHCLKATTKAVSNGHDIRYKPMAFVPVWAIDGGRNGSRGAFNRRCKPLHHTPPLHRSSSAPHRPRRPRGGLAC